jgi:hypothetical protein
MEINRYNKVLEGNKRYVEKKKLEDPNYFVKLAKG